MVMGGAKPDAIERNSVLSKYHKYFGSLLNSGVAKVMVIGYGFADEHINNLLLRAGVEHGMQMHLVNPSGLNVFSSRPQLEDIPLVGVTSRTLREFFSGDKLSQKSLKRFFAQAQ